MASLTEPTLQTPNMTTQPSAENVWYLAYGSNMKSSVMAGRGIVPLEVRNVYAPEYYLTFDIFGVPYAEPSFASVAKFADAAEKKDKVLQLHLGSKIVDVPPVHGIAYLLSAKDYHRLVVTEGGGVAYDEISLEAFTLTPNAPHLDHNAEKLMVRTLKAKYPWSPNGSPSVRYKGLLIEGCKEHQLPSEYLEYLNILPSYQSNYWHPGAFLFLICWRPWLRCLIRLIRIRTDEHGHCPNWLGFVILTLYGCMWGYHDRIHCKIWKRGDGMKLHFRTT